MTTMTMVGTVDAGALLESGFRTCGFYSEMVRATEALRFPTFLT